MSDYDHHLAQQLSRGSYGIVFSIPLKKTGEIIIIKKNLVPKASTGYGPLNELQILRQLANTGVPYVVKLRGIIWNSVPECPAVCTDKDSRIGPLTFILEKASSSLLDLMESNTGIDLIDMSTQLLLGLEFIHSLGIVHRDIKPENILAYDNGGNIIFKYCDFGMSKFLFQNSPMTPRCSTSWYRSIEQSRLEQYDNKTDIWSLGTTILGVIMGTPWLAGSTDSSSSIAYHINRNHPDSEIINKKYRQWNDIPVSDCILEHNSREVIDGSLSLCSRMLKLDKTRRPSAPDCLNHPFFDRSKELIMRHRIMYPPIRMNHGVYVVPSHPWRTVIKPTIIELYDRLQSARNSDYSYRHLFHMSILYDRILVHMGAMNSLTIDTKVINDPQLVLFYCLYVVMKYHDVQGFDNPLSKCCPLRYKTAEYNALFISFERYLLEKITGCVIYIPMPLDYMTSIDSTICKTVLIEYLSRKGEYESMQSLTESILESLNLRELFSPYDCTEEFSNKFDDVTMLQSIIGTSLIDEDDMIWESSRLVSSPKKD